MSTKGKSSKKSKGKGKAEKEETPALAHSTKGIAKKNAEAKPVGSRRMEEVVCESAGDQRSDLPPIHGHTGIFAYHMDDCLCGMAGWPCYR
ncbi:hypothetical protein, partial [Salmonella sp. s54925]|uniref:hypothetical protein n=1 Tax=Salmonella sp. s54925 TaxID=3159674 RepID=UPI003980D9A8